MDAELKEICRLENIRTEGYEDLLEQAGKNTKTAVEAFEVFLMLKKERLYQKYKDFVPEALVVGLTGEKLWDVVIDFAIRHDV